MGMKAIWATAALVLVAGCGGGAAGGQRHAAPVDDPHVIGKAAGCSKAMKADPDTMAQQEMICHADGKRVSVARFSDRATMIQFAKLASSFGSNCAVVNDHWGVCSNNRPLVKRAAAANGWKIVT